MDEVKTLILTIVKPLVDNPEEVTVSFSETDAFLEYTLHVNPTDFGRIIGKNGRVAKAIRTLVYSLRVSATKRVHLKFLED